MTGETTAEETVTDADLAHMLDELTRSLGGCQRPRCGGLPEGMTACVADPYLPIMEPGPVDLHRAGTLWLGCEDGQ